MFLRTNAFNGNSWSKYLNTRVKYGLIHTYTYTNHHMHVHVHKSSHTRTQTLNCLIVMLETSNEDDVMNVVVPELSKAINMTNRPVQVMMMIMMMMGRMVKMMISMMTMIMRMVIMMMRMVMMMQATVFLLEKIEVMLRRCDGEMTKHQLLPLVFNAIESNSIPAQVAFYVLLWSTHIHYHL